MTRLLLIGCGGFAGSVARYLVAGWAQRLAPGGGFPAGTLVVNVTGCLLIGVLAGLAEERGVLGTEARALLMIGLMGGFTTFSTFGLETINLLRDGEPLAAALNIGASVVLGVLAVWVGLVLARMLPLAG